ncbi:MAG: nucleotide pyrophosphatase/phosphodiesterase family protein [Microbacteriaceae bacterium]
MAGRPSALGAPAVTKAVVLLVDGLGAAALKARSGHARTLNSALTGAASTVDVGFPTTTAASLATLTTGAAPGQHGLVGYSVLDPVGDRVVNQLNGWDAHIDPALWQLEPTVFERAAAEQIISFTIGPERFRHSGFTHAVLRGASYRSAESIADRLRIARLTLDEIDRGLLYVYVPELDKAAHAFGVESVEWTTALEELDGVVRDFVSPLRAREGLIVTADHGVLDVPERGHVLFDRTPGLVDGVRHVGGEPRCLQLYCEPGTDVAALAERWADSEGARAWVATRDEAIAANWFGEVKPEVRPRIGDILVAARKRVAYYDSRSSQSMRGRGMIGQHGSLSPEESRVPLLRFGAFAS